MTPWTRRPLISRINGSTQDGTTPLETIIEAIMEAMIEAIIEAIIEARIEARIEATSKTMLEANQRLA
jgi:L-aminopeptidase/D-esterase-like protein